MDYIAPQAPLSVEFSKQEYWSGLPCLPQVDLPDPGIELVSSAAPALQADSLLLKKALLIPNVPLLHLKLNSLSEKNLLILLGFCCVANHPNTWWHTGNKLSFISCKSIVTKV